MPDRICVQCSLLNVWGACVECSLNVRKVNMPCFAEELNVCTALGDGASSHSFRYSLSNHIRLHEQWTLFIDLFCAYGDGQMPKHMRWRRGQRIFENRCMKCRTSMIPSNFWNREINCPRRERIPCDDSHYHKVGAMFYMPNGEAATYLNFGSKTFHSKSEINKKLSTPTWVHYSPDLIRSFDEEEKTQP